MEKECQHLLWLHVLPKNSPKKNDEVWLYPSSCIIFNKPFNKREWPLLTPTLHLVVIVRGRTLPSSETAKGPGTSFSVAPVAWTMLQSFTLFDECSINLESNVAFKYMHTNIRSQNSTSANLLLDNKNSNWPGPGKLYRSDNNCGELSPTQLCSSYQLVLRWQYATSEVLVGWLNSFKNSLSPHLSVIGLGGAVSEHFCNFPKPTVWHSHPLHARVGQLCRGEKGARIWTFPSATHF